MLTGAERTAGLAPMFILVALVGQWLLIAQHGHYHLPQVRPIWQSLIPRATGARSWHAHHVDRTKPTEAGALRQHGQAQ